MMFDYTKILSYPYATSVPRYQDNVMSAESLAAAANHLNPGYHDNHLNPGVPPFSYHDNPGAPPFSFPGVIQPPISHHDNYTSYHDSPAQPRTSPGVIQPPAPALSSPSLQSAGARYHDNAGASPSFQPAPPQAPSFQSTPRPPNVSPGARYHDNAGASAYNYMKKNVETERGKELAKRVAELEAMVLTMRGKYEGEIDHYKTQLCRQIESFSKMKGKAKELKQECKNVQGLLTDQTKLKDEYEKALLQMEEERRQRIQERTAKSIESKKLIMAIRCELDQQKQANIDAKSHIIAKNREKEELTEKLSKLEEEVFVRDATVMNLKREVIDVTQKYKLVQQQLIQRKFNYSNVKLRIAHANCEAQVSERSKLPNPELYHLTQWKSCQDDIRRKLEENRQRYDQYVNSLHQAEDPDLVKFEEEPRCPPLESSSVPVLPLQRYDDILLGRVAPSLPVALVQFTRDQFTREHGNHGDHGELNTARLNSELENIANMLDVPTSAAPSYHDNRHGSAASTVLSTADVLQFHKPPPSTVAMVTTVATPVSSVSDDIDVYMNQLNISNISNPGTTSLNSSVSSVSPFNNPVTMTTPVTMTFNNPSSSNYSAFNLQPAQPPTSYHDNPAQPPTSPGIETTLVTMTTTPPQLASRGRGRGRSRASVTLATRAPGSSPSRAAAPARPVEGSGYHDSISSYHDSISRVPRRPSGGVAGTLRRPNSDQSPVTMTTRAPSDQSEVVDCSIPQWSNAGPVTITTPVNAQSIAICQTDEGPKQFPEHREPNVRGGDSGEWSGETRDAHIRSVETRDAHIRSEQVSEFQQALDLKKRLKEVYPDLQEDEINTYLTKLQDQTPFLRKTRRRHVFDRLCDMIAADRENTSHHDNYTSHHDNPARGRQPSLSPDNTCVICLESLNSGVEVFVSECAHRFHKDCVDLWFATRNFTCPTCRTFQPDMSLAAEEVMPWQLEQPVQLSWQLEEQVQHQYEEQVQQYGAYEDWRPGPGWQWRDT